MTTEPTTINEASTAELLGQLQQQTTRLIHDELRLAQREFQESARHAGLGAGLISAAGLLAVLGLMTVVAAAVAAIALALPVWAAALIAGLGAGLISAAGLLAVLGLMTVVAAAVAAIALALPVWAAALIVAAVLFLGAGVAALVSRSQAKQVPPPASQSVDSVKQDLDELKEARHGHR
ncbi:phage holin family protein [Mycolicibacterium peregrinum]|uniref:phage holin family protein n=1 Tax=Mycolicibacterium peregrinum TaxID=43304 RepID=UPI0006D83C8F|nr:phage holin family protein [Mycolicibacterium peregrinum]